jgi:Raf kinase inhibitor-like YbhB/YbcL family protein
MVSLPYWRVPVTDLNYEIVDKKPNQPIQPTPQEAMMKISSPAFGNGEKIPSKYTCDGQNINPPLEISQVPEGAKSLVLIMEDPDVPKNLRKDGMWDHWVVFDMPADLRNIAEADTPGIEGIGTNGKPGYMGPCPPDREHRYFFKLFALDTASLALDASATKADVRRAMTDHLIAQTELMGRYERV